MTEEEEANEILQKYASGLNEVVQSAWSNYQNTPNLHKLGNRTKACMMRDFCIYEAEIVFSNDKDIQFINRGQLFLIGIKQTYFIRIKKLDHNLKARNAQTRQSANFSNQTISMFDDSNVTKSVLLNFGYVMSLDWQTIKKVVIAKPSGNKVEWHMDISPQIVEIPISQDITDTTIEQKASNVRIKSTIPKKKVENT